MAHRFDTLSDFYAHGYDTVIDVRAPGEFADDHIPGAISLPVLDDEERARVGTIYTQVAPFEARKIGAALVSRNAARHIEGPLAARDGSWRPLVYCWRGGQRSGSFAAILAQVGWRVETIEGGYKSYRGAVQSFLYDTPWPGEILLLDGNTGTGKTALLPLLAERGVQVIDLEGLAGHRGSIFGATGAGQPSQKGFESLLARALSDCDPSRPLVVEAESSKIGECLVPPVLWHKMRQAERLTVEAPVSARVSFLLRAYRDIVEDRSRLDAAILGLRRLQGLERTEAWMAMANDGNLAGLAEELIRHHYDPRYARQRGDPARPPKRFGTEALDDAGLADLADRISRAVNAIEGEMP